MIELGKMQSLIVVRKAPEGLYLNAKGAGDGQAVLLPREEAPQDINTGAELEVFVYADPESGMFATLKRPKLVLGELALLKVVDITRFGAFLDWGLDKDLLLPLKEQTGRLIKGKPYLVGLFVNNRGRLCATMKIYDRLSAEPPYKKNEQVGGTIYSINKEMGAFVAVDNKYHGLILNKELYGDYAIGDQVQARIVKVRPDGKLELSLRQKAYKEIEHDAQNLLNKLKDSGGFLPFNDDSPPELIKDQLKMSKRAFKRALGRLLQEGAVRITDTGIELAWN